MQTIDKNCSSGIYALRQPVAPSLPGISTGCSAHCLLLHRCVNPALPSVTYGMVSPSHPAHCCCMGLPLVGRWFFSPSQGLSFSWVADTRRIAKGAHITESFICSCVKYYTETSSHLRLYFRQKSQGSISQLAITQPGKKLFNE